ncbi:hypothetical protein [Absidia glauca]|uniref:Uncharacterized protein n=1 Tax=Absidia glauca TaxID=4829 RepID=A0A168T0Q6_ABSGL|nr:hypothetical protein [Absidia glauca]
MNQTIRVVPWTTNQEFQNVFEWLYANIDERPDLVQLGVDRVKAWVSRGRIPISVRATMDLIELQLRERKQEQGGPSLSQNELRLLYSSVLTRFVNIMEDSLQTTYFAKSLYVIAREIGLPLHFVQLRHAATHEDLPSLPVLRNAGIEALQWLYDSYWMAQVSLEALSVVNEQTLSTMSALMGEYKEKRKAHMKKRSTDGGMSYMKCTRQLIPLLSRDTLQDSVIVQLLKVGGLVPTAKKKRATLNDTMLSDDLIMLWKPLLQELDKEFPTFAPELVSALTERIDAGNSFTLESASSSTILDQEQEKIKQPSYLATLNDILEGCLRKPNTYTRSVLRTISNVDPELGQSIKPFIDYMYHIDQTFQSHPTSDKPNNSQQSSTASNLSTELQMEEEMKAAAHEFENLKKKLGMDQYTAQSEESTTTTPTGALSSTGWTLHEEKSWSSCPIGCLPNGKIPRLDLVASADPMMVD